MKVKFSDELQYKIKVLLMGFLIVIGFFISSFIIGSYFFPYSSNPLDIKSHSIIATIVVGFPYSLFTVGVLIFGFKIIKYLKNNVTLKIKE